MPLEHSKSPEAFKRNVSTLMGEVGKSPHVQSRAQALAIAYETQRRGRDMGGSVNDDQSLASYLANALQNYSGSVGIGGGLSAPSPAGNTGLGSIGGFSNPPTPSMSPAISPSPVAGPTQVTPSLTTPMPNATPPTPEVGGSPGMQNNPTPPVPSLGVGLGGYGKPFERGGVAKLALGGPPAPWYARAEARSMMHSGPVMSMVPGRTDRHNVSVASGSYILPADVVSHLGQNNTMAGMGVASHLFGKSGPYGTPAMRMGHGAGLPKPPKAIMAHGGATDTGGARGEGSGAPTPVVVAGGEFAIDPDVVRGVALKHFGKPDLNLGHKMLDRFVLHVRQKHIKTLKGLPGPAKS